MTPPRPVDEVVARLGERARRDEPLGPRTTYRVGGPAAVLVEVDDPAALLEVAAAVAGVEVDVLVIGRGSNLLVADAGFDGLVVSLGDGFGDIDVDAEAATVRAGAGANLPRVARTTARAGLTGFEWAVGVPGTIGGAVRMNAGGHGSDLAASLRAIRAVDLRTGEDVEVPAADLDLGYRSSALRAEQVVVHADLQLAPGDREAAEAEVSEIVAWRRANQPGGANAGSVFTNPPGDSAGRLIDACGLKGLRLGTAEVSSKHANFIQADDGGSADDVAALMREVRRRVHQATGVDLRPENHVVGFAPDLDPHAPLEVER
jgi:UDP-N-acetylmuramate dehydrogenase